MGSLYHDHHAYDGRDIEKLEQALECFRKANDKHYQIVCLKDLGAMYRGTNTDKAEEKLNEAIALATSANDTNNLINSRNNLAYLYFMMGQKDKTYYSKAYKELQHIKRFRLKGLPEKAVVHLPDGFATGRRVRLSLNESVFLFPVNATMHDI